MEEIDIKELLEFFISKLYLLISIVAIVCILGSIYGLFFQKPMYNSYTTVVLSGTETQITQNDVNLNKNLVDTYAEIVKSKKVLNQVIKNLKLNISYESLADLISVSSVNDTEIIKISVNSLSSIDAKNIANATANVFIKEVSNLYSMDNVNVLDEADESLSPYNINVIKQIVIYFLVGAILAVGIIFIIYYFDRKIRSIEQVEQKLKMPILGGVHVCNKGGK